MQLIFSNEKYVLFPNGEGRNNVVLWRENLTVNPYFHFNFQFSFIYNI